MKTITQKFFIFFVCSSLLPLLILGGYGILTNKTLMEVQIKKKLQALSKLKQNSLYNFYYEVRDVLRAFSRNRNVKETLLLHQENPAGFKNSTEYKIAYDLLLNYQEVVWGEKLHHIYLSDIEGNIILSPPHGDATTAHEGQNFSHSEYFQQALKKSTVSEFFAESNHLHQLFMEPVFDEDGKTLGIVIGEVLIPHQLKLLKDNFELGKTGKIYFTTLDGTEVVHETEAKKEPLKRAGLYRAIQEKVVMDEFVDSNGVTYLGLYLHDDMYPWILGIEVARNEVFAPIHKQIQIATIILLTILSLCICLGYFISRSTVNSLQGTVLKLSSSTHKLSYSSRQIGTSTKTMASGSMQQAASLEETSNSMKQMSENTKENVQSASTAAISMEELANMVKESAKKAKVMCESSESNRLAAESGVSAMSEISDAMKEISQAGEKINDTVEILNEITSRTKILAANAAIEAAHAGEQGKSFAVVSGEVSKLSENSKIAAKEIKELISESNLKTEIGKKVATKGEQALNEILKKSIKVSELGNEIQLSTEKQREHVKDVNSLMHDIQEASEEQAHGIEQITNAIIDMDQVTQVNASNAEEIASTGDDLTHQVHVLKNLMAEILSHTGLKIEEE